MTWTFRCLAVLVLWVTGGLRAEDRPSWAVVNAADRLIARHALFLPGGDGFAQRAGGRLTQFELPEKGYFRTDTGWRVELLSRRWRNEEERGWLAWNDARPTYSAWKIGVIRVDVLASGVSAAWLESANFNGCIAPSESAVRQRLNTLGQGRGATPPFQSQPVTPLPGPEPQPGSARYNPPPAPGSGIFRRLADGSLQKVGPLH